MSWLKQLACAHVRSLTGRCVGPSAGARAHGVLPSSFRSASSWQRCHAAARGPGGRAATSPATQGSEHADKPKEAFGRVHVPYGETGTATYSKLTIGCFDVVMNTCDMMEDSVSALALPADFQGHVRLADFGSADGGPEMPLLHWLKRLLPAACDLEVCFEDQANNDFKSLFFLANGIETLPVDCPGLRATPGIYFTACGRSFFEQCLPKSSADICTSFTAVHWLSQLPCTMQDSVHHIVSRSPEPLEKFASQAAQDWEAFLTHRSSELKPGGQGVIATLAQDPQGRYLGWSGEAGSANMYAELNACWDGMLAKGRITEAEHAAATFCNYYRTEMELQAPFEGERLGLRLKKLEWRSIKCPYGRGQGTPDELVGTVRTWSNSTFLSALDAKRGAKERAALVDELYDSYRRAIAAKPQRHAMDYMHAYLHFEKC